MDRGIVMLGWIFKIVRLVGYLPYWLLIKILPTTFWLLLAALQLIKSQILHARLIVRRKFRIRIKLKPIKLKPIKFTFGLTRNKIAGASLIILAMVVFQTEKYLFKDLPTPDDLKSHQSKLTTHILDRNGKELYKIYKDENRSRVYLNELPKYVIDATVAIEDKEFWNHVGFSPTGIIRAAYNDVFGGKPGGRAQGGSTITQQLIKNTLLSPEVTIRRKIRELVLAVWVENKFSKSEILEMYLNEVSYGGTAYGIQEAAWQYFGKPARDLTLAEATLLAGLPAAPTIYSPLGANPEMAKTRQEEVLRRMVEEKYITAEEAEETKAETLAYTDGESNIKAPHFVMYVRDLLVKQFGEDLVTHGGLTVTTALDLPTQDFVQKTVTEEVDKLARMRVGNGAAMVTNPATGEILAMVGSKDYFDFKHDGQVNVALRPRQPGSSIKPINYAVALQKGFTPASIILDAPISYKSPGSPAYTPVNYDGKFHGPVTVRTALGSSYNVPAVKILSTYGINAMIDQAEAMGITTWKDRSRFGLSLTLGGGEILMKDMAEAYGTLANYGIRVPINPILKVANSKGEIIYQKTQNTLNASESDSQIFRKSDTPSFQSVKNRVLPMGVAYQISNILSDNNARAPAFGMNSVLNIPGQEVAVKTGTTNSMRDNWTFGYTTDYLVATWVGNNDNTPMSNIASGITGASPIWSIIMKHLLAQNEEPHAFAKPNDLVTVKICVLTGQLSCEGCPSKEETFVAGTEPKTACTKQQIEEIRKKQEDAKAERDKILQGASTEKVNGNQ